MLLSHIFLMSFYALIVSLFFSLLWKREPRAQMKLFLQLFIGMMAGGILLAWLMYPFPSGPPTPFPS